MDSFIVTGKKGVSVMRRDSLEKYLQEERHKSGDISMESEPLSANQYENALITILRQSGVSDGEILGYLKDNRNLEDIIKEKGKNSVSVAKQDVDKNSCSLSDIEYMENISSYWSINEDGEPIDEVSTTDGDFVCYHCFNCDEEFKTFKEVKEHINE